MAKRKNTQKKVKINVFLCIVIALVLSFSLLVTFDSKLHFKYIPSWKEIIAFIKNEPPDITDPQTTIHYIDVGQGDSILIKSKDTTVLIDSGEKEYSKKVIDYINSLNIRRIDIIIATHPHTDHIGGMADIIDNFKVDKIIMPKLSDDIVPTTKTYTGLLTAIGNKGLKITPAKAGQTFDVGEGKLEIVAPSSEFEDLNNMSVVAKFTSNGYSTLFTGDIESKAEKDMLNQSYDLDVDFFKVPHHGSNSSSTEAFLKAVTPTISIISVGDGNKYNHPHSEIVKRLKGYSKDIYRTDISGTIVIKFASNAYEITVEKEK